MNNKDTKSSKYRILAKSCLSSIKGGKKEDEESYIIVYINGVPHKIKIDKNGNQISPPQEDL